jgi:hypothetical protein
VDSGASEEWVVPAQVVTSIVLLLKTQTSSKISTPYRMCVWYVSEYEPNKWTGDTSNSNYINIF